MRRRLAFLLFALLVSCGSDGNDLILNLRTDMVPGLEFAGARVEVETTSASGVARIRTVNLPAADFIRGQRLTQFSGIPNGTLRIRTTLINERGAAVLQKLASAEISGTFTATIVMTRDCRGVECNSVAAEACLGGACMDASCTPETPEFCISECAADVDCAASLQPCAEPRCLDGFCFYRAFDERCESGEVCSPDDGCVPGPPPAMDGGMFDGGMDADGGGACCDDGNPCTEDICAADGTCSYRVRESGTACDDGLSCTPESACNGTGVCVGAPDASSCVAAGRCLAAGDPNPLNPCRVCQPGAPLAFTPLPEGTECSAGGSCDIDGICQVAIPAPMQPSTADPTPTTYRLASENVAFGYANDCLGFFSPTSTFSVIRRDGDGVWSETDDIEGRGSRFGERFAADDGFWAFGSGERRCGRGDDAPRAYPEIYVHANFGATNPQVQVIDVGRTDFELSMAAEDLFVRLAQAEVEGITRAGEVQVYARDSEGTFVAAGSFSAPTAVESAAFGSVVASDDGRALISATGEPYGEGDDAGTGVVYVYERNAAREWIPVARLESPPAQRAFGDVLALDGDLAIARGGGAVYSFQREPDGTWRALPPITSGIGDGGSPTSGFARSLVVAGERLLVGANGEVHYYQLDAARGWVGAALLVSEDGDSGFGSTLTRRGDTLAFSSTGVTFFSVDAL